MVDKPIDAKCHGFSVARPEGADLALDIGAAALDQIPSLRAVAVAGVATPRRELRHAAAAASLHRCAAGGR